MSDDINVNMIADQLSKKVDLPDNKGQDGIDYVVEWKNPTESDPTWYRVYKSGWVEQGGRVFYGTEGDFTINFPKEMADNLYCSQITLYGDTSAYNNPIYATHMTCWNMTTNSMVTKRWNGQSVQQMWKVSGQGANQ